MTDTAVDLSIDVIAAGLLRSPNIHTKILGLSVIATQGICEIITFGDDEIAYVQDFQKIEDEKSVLYNNEEVTNND